MLPLIVRSWARSDKCNRSPIRNRTVDLRVLNMAAIFFNE
jgi:hypothetical protein